MLHRKIFTWSLLLFTLNVAVCFAQNQRFVITLKEPNLQELRNAGQLVSSVRGDSIGKIGSVLLQFEGATTQEPIEQDPGFALDGQKITLVVDEKMIALMKTRPIRMPLPKDALNFRNLVMLYTQSTAPTPPPKGAIVDADGKELDIVYLTLDTAQILVGGIEGLAAVQLDTEFGNVKLSLPQIAGIRFNTNDNKEAVVFLKNGDSLTGRLKMKGLNLKTVWGLAEINVDALQSLTITPESRFSNLSTDFGMRWILELGDSIAPDTLAPDAPSSAPSASKRSVLEEKSP